MDASPVEHCDGHVAARVGTATSYENLRLVRLAPDGRAPGFHE